MTKWRKVAIAACLAVILALSIAWLAQAQEAVTGIVRSITDGDTFVVQTDADGPVNVRLFGVNACERGTAEGDVATKWAIGKWLGMEVRCIRQGTSYNRLVAVCYDTGSASLSDLAWMVIQAGHAHDVPEFSGGYYAGGPTLICS